VETRSGKKLVAMNMLETERSFKQSVNTSHRKPQSRTEKSVILGERTENCQTADLEQVGISQE
jgi:hypothetical protein